MLVVDFDSDRPHAIGQFHVRLIDSASGDYGNDARRQNQLGYWCDSGHLESGVLRPVLAALKQDFKAHRHCDLDPIECSYDALVGEHNELRRKHEALVAYIERRSWWRRLWRG